MNRQETILHLRENIINIKRIVFSSFPPKESGKPTFAQMGIVFMLEESGEKTAREIADHFQISPSAITQLVNGLVQKKIITRAPDKTDARKTKLKLTELGKKYLIEIKKDNLKIFTQVFKTLSDEELLTLNNLQGKLIENMRNTFPHS